MITTLTNQIKSFYRKRRMFKLVATAVVVCLVIAAVWYIPSLALKKEKLPTVQAHTLSPAGSEINKSEKKAVVAKSDT